MARREKKTHISDLPDGVFESIFGKLPLRLQCGAKAVCKDWRYRLSRCSNRVKEEWIIVNQGNHLVWYNVTHNKWLSKKMNLVSLPPLVKNSLLCCVFEELLFFVSARNPPSLSCWNAATNKTRVLDIQAAPWTCYPLYGAYVKSGELNFMLYKCKMETGPKEASTTFYRCVEGGTWWKCPLEEGLNFPNFNSIAALNPVVTFVDDSCSTLVLYHADQDSFELLVDTDDTGDENPIKHYAWDGSRAGARFHFSGHGSFVVGESENSFALGVLWYDPGKKRFEVVSETPEGLMSDESGGVLVMSFFCFCSDGVENIWALFLGCSRMLRYNVVSKVWSVFSIFCRERMLEGIDYVDDAVRVLYTTF